MQSAHSAVSAATAGSATVAPRSPAELARETLRQLALRRLAPTPDNYQRVYGEISGAPASASEDTIGLLVAALHDLPKSNAVLTEPAVRMQRALVARNWRAFSAEITALSEPHPVDTAAPTAPSADETSWPDAIRELLKQHDLRHAAVSPHQKQQGLERVLGAYGRSPQLKDKLVALVQSWGSTRAKGTGIDAAPANPPSHPPARVTERLVADPSPNAPTGGSALAIDEGADGLPIAAAALSRMDISREASATSSEMLRRLLSEVLRHDVAPRFAISPDLNASLVEMSVLANQADSPEACAVLSARLNEFWSKAEKVGAQDGRLVSDLMGLVRLLVDNIGELVDDDQWMGGQVEVMRQIMAQPLTPQLVTAAQMRFREIIARQSSLKNSLSDAKNTLRDMISIFVERLGEMSQSTTEYHEKIGAYAEKIERTDDMGDLREVLDGLMGDIRTMQTDAMRSRDEVVAAREQAQAAETKIRQLETELEEISEKVREDALTGSLNRRGLDEALAREAARAERYGNALCVSVIDLDNFKKLNDTHGHQAGDQALIHLVKVIKSLLRPSDSIGRFGGEEFVVLLPETTLEAGKLAIERLQRELTKQFFLANNEKLLITFSAGVAQLRKGETEGEVVKRADDAMYAAKQAGKNRVSTAQ